MKKRFRIWHLPLLSFFSRQLYRDVATRWKGTNLGFLCLLLALCLLPPTRNISRFVGLLIDEYSADLVMQVPEIQINKGLATVTAPQPYSVIQGNRTVLLIDTTGQIDSLPEAGADALMTATHIYIDQGAQPPIVYDFSEIDSLHLNQEVAAELVERLKRLFLPAFYTVTLIASYIALLLAALLSGAFACLVGKLRNKKVSYSTGLRLSVVAFTPPLIINALLALFERTIPFYLYPLLGLAYLVMAVGCCRKKQQEGTLQFDDDIDD